MVNERKLSKADLMSLRISGVYPKAFVSGGDGFHISQGSLAPQQLSPSTGAKEDPRGMGARHAAAVCCDKVVLFSGLR